MPKFLILLDGLFREANVALTMKLFRDGKLPGDTPVRYGNVQTTLAAFAAQYGNGASANPEIELISDVEGEDEISLEAMLGDEPEAHKPLETPRDKLVKRLVVAFAVVFVASLATLGALFFARKPATPTEVARQPNEAAEETTEAVPDFAELVESDAVASGDAAAPAKAESKEGETTPTKSDAPKEDAEGGEREVDAETLAEPLFGHIFAEDEANAVASEGESEREETLEDFFASAKAARDSEAPQVAEESGEANEFDPEELFAQMDASIKEKSTEFEKELGDEAGDSGSGSESAEAEWAEDATADAASESSDAIRVGNNVVIIDELPTVKTWAETLRGAVETTESWEKKSATITVPGDAATLAEAIGKAKKGDVIALKAGKEIEVGWKRRTTAERSGLVVDKAVAIIGEEGEGDEGEATIIMDPSESLWITSKNVAIKNVVFKTDVKATTPIWRPIVAVVDSGALSVKNCRFVGARENGDSVGLNASGAEASAKLWKCAFEDFGNAGCLAETNASVKAQYCEFARAKYGLCSESDAEIEVLDSHFAECSAGYRAEAGGGGRVENCFFKSCANPVGASMGSSSKVVKDGIVRED